jgi:arylsulfatase A
VAASVQTDEQCDIQIAQWDLLPTLHDLAKSDQSLPCNLDGGSLRGVFEKGNEGKVERPVEGFVFHYPCYFAPPLSVIRLGDYKLMEHHLSGEQKLFNVVSDYAEKNNLVEEKPEKVAELKSVMEKYLKGINAENVQDVYKARFAELDRFEKGAREIHAKEIERAMGDQALIAQANEKLEKNLERFAKNRVECRQNMKGTTF